METIPVSGYTKSLESLSVLALFILKRKSMSINLSATEGEAIVLEDSLSPKLCAC